MEIDNRVLNYTIEQFTVGVLDKNSVEKSVYEKMRRELAESLRTEVINYLTAAYYLTKKHEFD